MGFWGVALRGYAMGAAELVPGVSSTIAFISGLYGPLLASLAAFDGAFLQLLRRATCEAPSPTLMAAFC